MTWLESLAELRSVKREQLDDLNRRERCIAEAQIDLLTELINERMTGRSMDGAIAQAHEDAHEALHEALKDVEAFERLTAEIREREGQWTLPQS